MLTEQREALVSQLEDARKEALSPGKTPEDRARIRKNIGEAEEGLEAFAREKGARLSELLGKHGTLQEKISPHIGEGLRGSTEDDK